MVHVTPRMTWNEHLFCHSCNAKFETEIHCQLDRPEWREQKLSEIIVIWILKNFQSCKNEPSVSTSRCKFFLDGAKFWAKHAKNCATMSNFHITYTIAHSTNRNMFLLTQVLVTHCYSMIQQNCNKVNSYNSAPKPLPRLPNRSKWPYPWDILIYETPGTARSTGKC